MPENKGSKDGNGYKKFNNENIKDTTVSLHRDSPTNDKEELEAIVNNAIKNAQSNSVDDVWQSLIKAQQDAKAKSINSHQ